MPHQFCQKLFEFSRKLRIAKEIKDQMVAWKSNHFDDKLELDCWFYKIKKDQQHAQ